MISGLVLSVLLSGVAADPAAAVLVGVRTSGKYTAILFRSSATGAFSASSMRGLLALTDVGPMFVDVVPDCDSRSHDRFLVIGPADDAPKRVPCLRGRVERVGAGRSDVNVLFVSSRYISVARSGESFNGRGWWSLDTRRWGQGTPVLMRRVLPRHVVAAIDQSASARRKAEMAEALREGRAGDADPCWYGDASRTSWGIVRSERRWVVLAQLESECIKEWYETRVPLPGEIVNDVHNDESPALVSGFPASMEEVAVSPDGGLAVTIVGSEVELRSVKDGGAGGLLAEAGIEQWRKEEGVSRVYDDYRDAVVMVQWLGNEALARWSDRLSRAFQRE